MFRERKSAIRNLNRRNTEGRRNRRVCYGIAPGRNETRVSRPTAIPLIFTSVTLLGTVFAAGEPRTQAAGQPALDKPADPGPGVSLATTPVEFSIAGTVYRVPRNYLITMSNWAGGRQEFVAMRVDGSHLTPLTEATRHCLSGDPFARSTEIMIKPALRTGCMPFQFNLADPDGREANGVTAEQEFEKIRSLAQSRGALVGPSSFEKYEFTLNDARMEAYRKVEAGRMLLYVCAVSDGHGRRDGVCRPIGDRPTTGTELNFVFSLSMLGVIEEIDANLRRLVDGFAVKHGHQP
jgi:hypothetical protein